MKTIKPIEPPARVLMGPGPSDVAASVLRAMSCPTLGHLDPQFLEIMDQVRGMLREVFRTKNDLTIPMSGTGSSGMETCFVNLLERRASDREAPRVLVGVNGVFGTRMADVARRCGAEVVTVEAPWGRAFDVDDFRKAATHQRFDLVCVVHAETSTGVHQDLTGFRAMTDELGALLLVDTVTSLGGLPVEVDAWGLDAVYSGTQKCLSCPPGLSPVTFSDRAWEMVKGRQVPVQSWYLDLTMIGQYWGSERVYHHTAPINMIYGLHEALRLILEEGLEARHARHRTNARALWAGLAAMGLGLTVPENERLVPLTTVDVPQGIDEARVRGRLLEGYGLEIGGGLGPMKGKVWRIGLMGQGSTRRNVTLCLAAIGDALRAEGYRVEGDPLAAADDAYGQA